MRSDRRDPFARRRSSRVRKPFAFEPSEGHANRAPGQAEIPRDLVLRRPANPVRIAIGGDDDQDGLRKLRNSSQAPYASDHAHDGCVVHGRPPVALAEPPRTSSMRSLRGEPLPDRRGERRTRFFRSSSASARQTDLAL
jgi:hypothetical protein